MFRGVRYSAPSSCSELRTFLESAARLSWGCLHFVFLFAIQFFTWVKVQSSPQVTTFTKNRFNSYHVFFFNIYSGVYVSADGWGKMKLKLKLTTLPRIFIHVGVSIHASDIGNMFQGNVLTTSALLHHQLPQAYIVRAFDRQIFRDSF